MTKTELDILWQKAMRESIEDGEMFTRYHFAKLVAAAERESIAKKWDGRMYGDCEDIDIGRAIRARTQHEAI